MEWSTPVSILENIPDPDPVECSDPFGVSPCGQHLPLQYLPAVAVDGQGRVGVMYYDTTIDTDPCDRNVVFRIQFTYSLDGGVSWEPPVTVSQFDSESSPEDEVHPVSFVNLGEYFAMTSTSEAGDGLFHPIWADLRGWEGEALTEQQITAGDAYTALITLTAANDPVVSMGDQDSDGDVDADDYGRLLACIAQTETDCEDFDFNRDGQVNDADKPLFCDCNVSMPAPFCDTCSKTTDCADTDLNGRRDDTCFWWECAGGKCLGTATVFPSDMGAPLGACEPDTFCNLADALLALDCFTGASACDRINIDAGGPLGACAPDGFCNLADALHALTCLENTSTCTCGESAMGSGPPEVVGTTSLRAVRAPLVAASDTITVRVFTETALDNLQSYQLELRVSGGTSGQFELLDIFIEPRSDYVFAGVEDNFTAFNVDTGQMLSGGLDIGAGVRTRPHAYLATYTYRASATATGEFVVDIPHDLSIGDQTFLVASFNKTIEVTDSTPAVVATAP